ncbi:hypothetical protein GON01_05725 [Sphingomonas sp. MAH-20]|jgi:hypothetical protein|uniref:Uncharacterized protein n=1 Tax=Sphingomonas horti TaxID=2682842 RepID=A0A6I4IZZ4_9SPHN|nr:MULTISPECIES: hypothetical protein [Sphingomonas]MBA2918471.1 hypothetical protein [Sphingomonas sp. CGMCC 1.13658]MVO77438.1 hypothetical protein [Sphingomonas horti]
MRSIDALPPARVLAWIVILALAGLIVRIAAASGALWLDEAWSAVLAHDVRTPLGVFVQINHDNNHHLNSLWLQWVGLGAPPLVARALSIATGTLAIVVAGLIGARRGPLVGIVTALLFALSPVLVSLGSEARGYAPMTLLLLIAAWYIDRYLSGDESANRPVTLAICFFLGALSQLTMAFAACALAGWLLLVLWRRKGLRTAAAETARLIGPALLALALALAIVFAPVLIGGTEFRFGSRQPFTLLLFLHGLIDLLGYTVGATVISFWLPAGAAILVVLARSLGTPRLAFYWLAVIAFPLTVAALHMMNVGHPRYYLLVAVALLLLLGEAVAAMVRAGGWKAVAGAGALLLFSGASTAANLELVRYKRGDPGGAIRALAARAPAGARVMIDRETGLALMQVAAAEAGYPVAITTACPAAPFVFADWFNGEKASPATIARCGKSYRAIAAAASRGLAGQNWTLYERVE